MFCVHCGKTILDGAHFCSYCGKEQPKEILEQIEQEKGTTVNMSQAQTYAQPSAQASSTATSEVANQAESLLDDVQNAVQKKMGISSSVPITHPYQKLGGWLAFFTYGWLISGILCILGLISSLISLASVNSMASGLGSITGPIMLIAVVYYGGMAYVGIRLFLLIQRKDTSFVQFYEKACIVTLIALIVVLFLTIGYLGSTLGEYSSFAVSSLLESVIPDLIGIGIAIALMLRYFEKSVRVRTYFGTDEYLRKSRFLKDKPSPEPAVPDYPQM